MKNISVIVMTLALLGLCSCKKSKEKEYDSWANKAIETVQSGATNWTATNGVNLQTNGQVFEMVNVLTKTVKSDVAKQMSIKTAEAGEFLMKLHENDNLPGVSKDEHGQIDSDVVPVLVSNKLLVVAYPMERTFHIVKNSYTSTNNYIVMKKSKDSEWELQRAWETDSKGQIIQEWPVR